MLPICYVGMLPHGKGVTSDFTIFNKDPQGRSDAGLSPPSAPQEPVKRASRPTQTSLFASGVTPPVSVCQVPTDTVHSTAPDTTT